MLKNLLFVIIFSTLSYISNSQVIKSVSYYSVNGFVKDSLSGEVLGEASIKLSNLVELVSNQYGFYSVRTQDGVNVLTVSHVGYESKVVMIDVQGNTTLNIELSRKNIVLKDITIRANNLSNEISSKVLGTIKLTAQEIKKAPALLGECDPIKLIQMTPGVLPAAEGLSAFNVRGGAVDQNLILLDDATVYNGSHIAGFISTFNNDAIKEVTLYKGDIPVWYGGRLSSALDVRMKEGNNKKLEVNGGVGLIASRLTIEGPIKQDKSSFIISGRRSYLDLLLKAFNGTSSQLSGLNFSDLNAKLNYTINSRNRIYFSAYTGQDVLSSTFNGMKYGNRTLTTRWNNVISNNLFFNLTLFYSRYHFEQSYEQATSNIEKWRYDISDYSLKGDFTFYSSNITSRFGFQSTYHIFNPGEMFTNNNLFKLSNNNSLENALYLNNQHDLTGKFWIKYGVRFSSFSNVGPATVFKYNDQYEVYDSTTYRYNSFYNTYLNFEPRVGLGYNWTPFFSLKCVYARTSQYLFIATNATAGTPVDMWVSASPNVKPQISDQFSMGAYYELTNIPILFSVEGFYRTFQNVVDFKDHPDLFLNSKIEGEMRFGTGRSYGSEFLVKLNGKAVNGWLGYTYSRSKRTVDGINENKEYISLCDKPHSINMVLNYNVGKRISLSGNWIFASGMPTTIPTGRAVYGSAIYPIYSERNTYRLPNYHRLDIGLTLHPKQKGEKLSHGEWVFSIYNVYARKNPWYVRFYEDTATPNMTKAEIVYLFTFVPSVTYNFKF